jgi:tetratricopeptide (TPR) repeat protein
VQEGNRYAVTGTIEDLEVPETLQALAAARLDNLDAAERTLLQDAAVLGLSFTPSALASISGRREADTREALDTLVGKQVLGRNDDQRSGEQGQYHFLQALLRTVALSTLGRRDRRDRHLAAAEHLRLAWGGAPEIAEVLASHYLDAVAADPDAPDAPTIRAQARTTLVAAGRRAVSLALGAEARAYLEHAAELTDDVVERASLLAEAGAAAARTADWQSGIRLLEEAIAVLDRAGEEQGAATTRIRLAAVLIRRDELEQAAELLERARSTLVEPAKLAELAALRAQIALLRGDFERTRDEAELALSIADPRNLVPVVADSATNKAIALYFESRLTEAGAMISMALSVSVEADLPEQALRAYFNDADFKCADGQIGEALELLGQGLALAQERGNRAWTRDLQAQRAQLHCLTGRWDEVLSTIESLGADEAAGGYRQAVAFAAPILAARGETAELQRIFDRSQAPSEWHELVLMETMARTIALASTGRSEEAVQTVEPFVTGLAHVLGASAAAFLLGIADVLLAAGRRDLAEPLRGDPSIRIGGLLEALQGLVRAVLDRNAGEVEAAEENLRTTIPTLRELGTPYLLARGLLAYGGLLSETGRGDQAAALVREARSLFAELRAAPWIDHADSVLEPAAGHDVTPA